MPLVPCHGTGELRERRHRETYAIPLSFMLVSETRAARSSVMNEYFVNIKVDKEERPDVDRVYMTYVQVRFLFNGQTDGTDLDCVRIGHDGIRRMVC